MPEALRYTDPVLCQKLAAAYVYGEMTEQVRRRMDRLCLTQPVLRAALDQEAEVLHSLQTQVVARKPNPHHWTALNKLLPSNPSTSGWQGVRPLSWAAALVFCFLLGGLSRGLWPMAPVDPARGPDYMAPLSLNNQIALVVNGYKGNESGPSFLTVQWDQDHSAPSGKPLYLWARSRADQSVQLLGALPANGESWQLGSSRWQALASSGSLFITNSDRLSQGLILYDGPCLRLNGWAG